MTIPEIGEQIMPRYRCDHATHGPYSGFYPEMEEHEQHADDGGAGPMTPVDVIGCEVECLGDDPRCDHRSAEGEGCTFSDCLYSAQTYQQCPECCQPARVRILSTPVRYES